MKEETLLMAVEKNPLKGRGKKVAPCCERGRIMNYEL
jgi:hypothetical protein